MRRVRCTPPAPVPFPHGSSSRFVVVDFVLGGVADRYGVGTTLTVVLGSQAPAKGSAGSAITTAVIGEDGAATFTGLDAETRYAAYALVGGEPLYTRFTTEPDPAFGEDGEDRLVIEFGVGSPPDDTEDFWVNEPDESSSREFYVPTFASRVAFGSDLDRLEGGVTGAARPTLTVSDADWVLDSDYVNGLISMEGLTQDRSVYIDKAVNAAFLPGQYVEVLNDSNFTVYVRAVAGVTGSNLPRALAPGMAATLTAKVTDSWFVAGGRLATTTVAPVLVTAPALSGTFRTGETVDADNGVWNVTVASFRYQWQEDTAGNGTFADIGGATSKTFELEAGQVGNQVRRATWATANGLESTVAYSNAQTSLAVAGSVPVGSGSLVIVPSSVQAGGTLSIGTSPSWTNSPTSFQYQWQEDLAGVWTNISGATSSTYVVQVGDTDPIRLRMWATNAAGQSASPVTSTNSITAGTPTQTMAELLEYDMSGTSEQLPYINTGWSFRGAPDPATWSTSRNIWNPWIQLAPQVGGNPSLCKVQVAHLQFWALRTDGSWVQMFHNQTLTAAMGNLYNSFTYADTGQISSRLTLASAAEGLGSKVYIGNEQLLWHAWTSGFYNLAGGGAVTPSNFAGGFAAVKARLDPATPELHATAKYVLSCAADQRLTTGDSGTIPNIGIGRWKTVDPEWKWYTMTFDESRMPAVWADDSIPFPTGYEGEFGSEGGGEGSGGGGSAPTTEVSFDGMDVVSQEASGTGLIGKTMTLSSGTNRLLVAFVEKGGTSTVTQAQIDGVAMTKLGESISTANANARQVEVWYRVAPPTGAHNIEVWGSLTGAAEMRVLSFSNVDQASPFRTLGTAYTDGGTSLDVSTTGGATTDLVAAAAAVRNAADVNPDASQTERWTQLRGTNVYSVGSTQDGSASTVHSIFTWSGSDRGAAAAVAIKAAT